MHNQIVFSPEDIQSIRKKVVEQGNDFEVVAYLIGYALSTGFLRVTAIVPFSDKAYKSRSAVHASFLPAYRYALLSLVPCFKVLGMWHSHPAGVGCHSVQDDTNLVELGNGLISVVDSGTSLKAYINENGEIRETSIIIDYTPKESGLSAIYSENGKFPCVFIPDGISDLEIGLLLKREIAKYSDYCLKVNSKKQLQSLWHSGWQKEFRKEFPVYVHVNKSYTLCVKALANQAICDLKENVLQLIGAYPCLSTAFLGEAILNDCDELSQEYESCHISLFY